MLFQHADWLALDRGTLTTREAAKRAAERTGITESRFMYILDRVPSCLTPITETIDLMYELKNEGHRIFILSNMQIESILYLEAKHSFWEIVDGRVISCRIKKIKPEIEIFDHLLKTFQINPSESIFIDDTDVNVIAAESMGIHTILFSGPQQCRSALVAKGVFQNNT